MNDPLLQKSLAALDDARDYLVDSVDNNPGAALKDVNHIDAARQFVNSAIIHIQKAQDQP